MAASRRLRSDVASKLLPACVLLAAASFATPSAAYCRATTCNPELEDCAPDEHGCLTRGVPLWWRRAQVDLLVDAAGSDFSAIDSQQAFLAVSQALSTWSAVVCRNDGPRAAFVLSALGSAPEPEAGNGVSEVRFVDAGWPHAATAVGHTALSFDLDSGEILEADIALNSEDFTFAVDATEDQVDLRSVLTHELGHALGLGHTDVAGATMQADGTSLGSAALRSLALDDEQGLCAVHADSWQAEPLSEPRGCSYTALSPKRNNGALALLALVATLVMRRRR